MISAATTLVRPPSSSAANLPNLNKQSNMSVNDTKDTLDIRDGSRRSSQGFMVKRPKMGDADFDYSNLNVNLR